MRNRFLSAVMLSLLMAAAFFSCTGNNEPEPETANVPSVATIDSLWATNDIFGDDVVFEKIHDCYTWQICKSAGISSVEFNIHTGKQQIITPQGSGNNYKFSPYTWISLEISPFDLSKENAQGYYSTALKSQKGAIHVGQQCPNSHLYYLSPKGDTYRYPIVTGRAALVKMDDEHYHARWEVSAYIGDELHYYSMDDTLSYKSWFN